MTMPNRADSPLEEVYDRYFEGLTLFDSEQLVWASGQLMERQGPLMRSAGIDGRLLAQALLKNPDEVRHEQLDFTLCDTIRSYEYSGLQFNGPQIQMTTAICGFSQAWLREILTPSPVVLEQVIGVTSRPQLELMRRQGCAALEAAGLVEPL